MLVLSRKENESIIINENIRLVVLEIRGNNIRLGFEAPKDVPIHRREVHAKLKRDTTPEAFLANPITPGCG